MGGSNLKGPDTDGVIYRLILQLKRNLGSQDFYLGAGVGYSLTVAHQHQFTDVSGYSGEFLLGYELLSSKKARATPFMEISWHPGTHPKSAASPSISERDSDFPALWWRKCD